MTRQSLHALALAVLLPLAGCNHIKTPVVAFNDDGDYLPRDVGEGLVVSPNPLIADVPMPVGFKAVASKCRFTQAGNIRVVQHVYQGHAEHGDAAEFYQRVLPNNGWALVEIQGVSSTSILSYTKGFEKLTVTTEDGWAVSTITIDIEGR